MWTRRCRSKSQRFMNHESSPVTTNKYCIRHTEQTPAFCPASLKQYFWLHAPETFEPSLPMLLQVNRHSSDCSHSQVCAADELQKSFIFHPLFASEQFAEDKATHLDLSQTKSEAALGMHACDLRKAAALQHVLDKEGLLSFQKEAKEVAHSA